MSSRDRNLKDIGLRFHCVHSRCSLSGPGHSLHTTLQDYLTDIKEKRAHHHNDSYCLNLHWQVLNVYTTFTERWQGKIFKNQEFSAAPMCLLNSLKILTLQVTIPNRAHFICAGKMQSQFKRVLITKCLQLLSYRLSSMEIQLNFWPVQLPLGSLPYSRK